MKLKHNKKNYDIDDGLIKIYAKYYKPNIFEVIKNEPQSLDDMLDQWQNNDLDFLNEITKLIKKRE